MRSDRRAEKPENYLKEGEKRETKESTKKDEENWKQVHCVRSAELME